MNLYLVVRNDENPAHEHWHDTYFGAVVAAPNEATARLIHPDGQSDWDGKPTNKWPTTPAELEVTLLGTADPSLKQGVIQTDFYEP